MESSDIGQLGVSITNHHFLETLKERSYFKEMQDAYRFAVAFAISKHASPASIQERQNMYGRATIDPDGRLAQVVSLLYPGTGQPYRLMESLADWGLTEMRRRFEAQDLDVIEILSESNSDT